MDEPTRGEWVKLDVEPPAGLADTFGARGLARLAMVFRIGDHWHYRRGLCSGEAAQWPCEAFFRHPAVAKRVASFSLSSDGIGPPEEALVIDTHGGVLFVAPFGSAAVAVREQVVPGEPEPDPDLEPLAETDLAGLLDVTTWEEVAPPDPAAIRAAMEREREAVARMLLYLDRSK